MADPVLVSAICNALLMGYRVDSHVEVDLLAGEVTWFNFWLTVEEVVNNGCNKGGL